MSPFLLVTFPGHCATYPAMRNLLLTSLILLSACTPVEIKPYEPKSNDEYIEQIEALSNNEIKSESLKFYSFVGAGLFIAGVGLIALTPKLNAGLVFTAGGGVAMFIPIILNSPWFDWLVGIAFTLTFLYGLYFLIRYSIAYFKSRNG